LHQLSGGEDVTGDLVAMLKSATLLRSQLRNRPIWAGFLFSLSIDTFDDW